MTLSNFISIVLIVTGLVYCGSSAPTVLERPKVDLSPWIDTTITSKESGVTYNVMMIEGPQADSPVLLQLPGGFIDHRVYYYTHALSKYFKVVAVDWPDDSPYYKDKVEDYGKVVGDILDTLGVKSYYAWSNSGGTAGIIEGIIQRPDIECKALILTASALMNLDPEETKSRMKLTKRALSVKPDRLRARLEKTFLTQSYPPTPGKLAINDIYYTRSYKYYHQLFAGFKEYGERKQELDKVKCPVLIIHGENDDTVKAWYARLYTTALPDAEYIEYKDQPHYFIFFQGEQVVSDVVRFLEKRKLLPIITSTSNSKS